MIDDKAAHDLAMNHIGDKDLGSGQPFLFEDLTQEHPFGWVFFYGARRDGVADGGIGFGPFIVLRESGDIVPLGTAMPVEIYIERFVATGNPFG